MGIPANAPKEDELFHYASLDPEAAAELARRITNGEINPLAQAERLGDEIHGLEVDYDDAVEERDNLKDNAAEACEWIKRAINHGEDEELPVSKLLQKALDCLE
jgi:hypothetical protein